MRSLAGRLALAAAGLFALTCGVVWLVVAESIERFAAAVVAGRMEDVVEDLRGAWATAEITGLPPSGPADLAWLWQIAVDGEVRWRAALLEPPYPPATAIPGFVEVEHETLGPLWLTAQQVREVVPAPPDAPPASRRQPLVTYVVAVTTAQRDAWIAEQAAPLRRLAFGIMAALAGSLLATLGVLAILLRRPLRRLAEAADRQRRGETAALEGDWPRELAGVVESLNAALALNARLVERTRRYVGKIAHDLKHPLAVVRNALDRPDERDLARRRLDGMAALIDRYAALARAIGPGTPGPPVDVAALLEEARAGFALLYRQPPAAIEVDCPPGLAARIAAADLEAVVSNLLGNAHKHARGRIRVTARRASGLSLVVEDDGPGLAADDRRRAMEWGERLDESAPGSGFGLVIVQDILALYGGRLELADSPLGGLAATAFLPDGV